MASLINDLKSRQVIGQPAPAVGMGATLLGYTDRHAATIVQVSNEGKFIKIQQDTAKRTDSNGMSEVQTWEFTENKSGATYHFKQKKSGIWYEVVFNHETKRWNKTDSYKLRIGERSEYYDFSF